MPAFLFFIFRPHAKTLIIIKLISIMHADAIKTIKDIPDENYITGGHAACQGCGAALGLKLALQALGSKTIVINASGCMTLLPTYPFTPFRVPFIHIAIENAGAAAVGIAAALNALKKENVNIVCYAGDGACYSEDTEVFTESGFRNIKELKIGEKIWSVNPETNELELTEMEKLHMYFYKGSMVRVNTRFMDFLVTPNHNIPAWFTKRWKFLKAEELQKRYKTSFLRSFKWRGKDFDGAQPQLCFKDSPIEVHKGFRGLKSYNIKKFLLSKDSLKKWIRFLGWFIAEGCAYKSKSGYLIRIYQTNKENRKEILKLLECIGFKPFECNRSVDFQSKQLYEYLRNECGSDCYNKKIPRWIMELDKEYLIEIFYSLIKGDGSVHKQKNRNVPHMTFITSSKQLMNNFVELVLKLGKNCNVNFDGKVYRIQVNLSHLKHILYSKRNLYDRRGTKQITTEEYEGFVYCPQLKRNHTLIIKRNGKICLNGNSYDIGLQSLSHACELKTNFIYICYNNESFANTGVQWSSATPYGAHTSTTPSGRESFGSFRKRKPLTKIIAAHNIPYVATACVAYPVDYVNKLRKAAAMKGPKFIDLLTPCTTGWGFDPSEAVAIGRLAVESCMWPLYEVNNGKFLLTYKPQKKPVKDYLFAQRRFKHLSQEQAQSIQQSVDNAWENLLQGKFWEA